MLLLIAADRKCDKVSVSGDRFELKLGDLLPVSFMRSRMIDRVHGPAYLRQSITSTGGEVEVRVLMPYLEKLAALKQIRVAMRVPLAWPRICFGIDGCSSSWSCTEGITVKGDDQSKLGWEDLLS